MQDKKLVILALIIANIIWGAAAPIFKWTLTDISPFALAFSRFFIASLILFPFALRNLKIERKDLKELFLLSFFGITINISFFFYGLQFSPSINAPVIASSGPIFLILLGILFLKEHPKRKVILGTLLSLFGVILIVAEPIFRNGFDSSVLGNLFFVLATVGAVGYAIFSKKIVGKYQAVTVTFWSFVIGAISFIPLLIYEMSQPNFSFQLGTAGLSGLVFGVFFSSALAYFLYIWSIKKLPVSEIGVFIYLDPIVAVLIAIPLLGEVITLPYLIGTAFVFLGIFIAEGRLPYHPLHKLR